MLNLNAPHRVERFLKAAIIPISRRTPSNLWRDPLRNFSLSLSHIKSSKQAGPDRRPPRTSPPIRTRLTNSIDALSRCSLEAAGASRCPTTAPTMHCYHITRLSRPPKAKLSLLSQLPYFHHALASLLSHRKYVTASHRLSLTPCVSLQPFHRSCRLI
jgi:hypothetical protein